ncbi:MAG: aminotransferase class I/II-fold pyridoxal phosphate-dependent enzyme [Gracilimonas sp.]|uniref:DegT/DnrJ/EryC1/StrS family aminotransferase n=1 Tax=Gracilimonas sp. TaxID=1974203 RepID=UPI0019B31812|nr:aminotransferase class I/II-fold pyridoxal phosphate-dependent enzyme [Gracilimonas sp.]MBD3614994.1 aminotransferase class I/II-fold pyridoxal phosphate-dependent enzyme [Gracilimonas sp.]
MNKQKIWLSSPHMGGEELEYIHQAFEKNWIAPLGDNVNGFEDDLRNYTGTKAAGVFTSGTASIHLALILLGVEAGDEVLCQSFTFSATANPIRYQGAIPVFIDSEADTWNMDPELLEEAIKERLENSGEDVESNPATIRQTNGSRRTKLPKAILAVHLYGMPAKMDEIRAIGAKYGIPVIEDAAEALGSHINGQKCGSFGKLNVLSFNGNKIITTSGGGALLSDDEELIQKARFLATQARDDAPHYQHSQIGYNYRMSNIVAGVGRGQMKVLDERVAQRRAVHERYFEALGKIWLEGEIQNSKFKILNSSPTGVYFLKEPSGYFSNRWLTTVIINPEETGGVTREDIRLALAEENIEARPLWKPMHLQPVFESFPAYSNGLSEWLFEYGLCLPSGSNMSEEDQARVIKTIRETIA